MTLDAFSFLVRDWPNPPAVNKEAWYPDVRARLQPGEQIRTGSDKDAPAASRVHINASRATTDMILELLDQLVSQIRNAVIVAPPSLAAESRSLDSKLLDRVRQMTKTCLQWVDKSDHAKGVECHLLLPEGNCLTCIRSAFTISLTLRGPSTLKASLTSSSVS